MSPVLIVGAGPVGLSLALALRKAGIDVTVVEAGPGLSREARASTIHPPTLEFWNELGVAETVIAAGIRVDNLQYWERRTRELIADFDYRLIARDTDFPFRLQCPQRDVLPVLAQAFVDAGGTLSFDRRLTNLIQDDDGVTATIEGPEGTETHRCAWLCGCDGARSAVRSALDMPFPGKTYTDRFLLLKTDLDLDAIYPNIGPVAYIFDPSEWVIVMRVPGATRVVFRMDAEENAEEAMLPSAVRARLDRFVEETDYQIHSTRIYRVHQRVADSFRKDRVLLAGDAAHINNPAGGMGMNSGVHDAEALSRALIATIQRNDAGALYHYAKDRRAVAIDGIQAHTDRHYGELGTSEEEQRLARNQSYRNAASDPLVARRWLLQRAMLAERMGGAA